MNYTIFIGRKITDTTRILLLQNNIDFEEGILIDIQLTQPDLSIFKQLKEKRKAWVITSSWAAKWLKINHLEIDFDTEDLIFCLSEKQAEVLKEFSNRIYTSEEPNVNSVSDLVKHKNKGFKIVYLAGNQSIKTLEAEFQSSEISFYQTEVYRNTSVAQLIDEPFDAYLFFSPSGIKSFIDAGNRVPISSLIFTIGKTTGFAAAQHFQNIILESPVQEEAGFVAFAVEQLKAIPHQPTKTES